MAKLVNIQFGPFFSYAVYRGAEEAIENVSDRGKYSLENIIKKYDYGVSLSIQLFPITNFFTNTNFYIRLIYDHSLSNI